MRCLLYVSCFLLIGGCSSSYSKLQRYEGDNQCVQAFKPSFTTALYKAQVNVAGRHLSGLLIIKTMPDSSIRIVFTNEAGFKFFDFGFHANNFEVYYIYKEMDKKALLKTLRKDFELVLMLHLNAARSYLLKEEEMVYHVFANSGDFYYYITDTGCSKLISMERGSKKKKVVQAMFGSYTGTMPDTIGIAHTNFNFTIELKRLNDDFKR